MATNVEVERNNNENALGILRRFTKRVQGSGVLSRVRSLRYTLRTPSFYKKKKRTLEGIRRREEYARLVKLGKITPVVPGQRGPKK